MNINNQNVLVAEAQYREAKALVREARAGLFPTATVGPGVTESHANPGASATGTRAAFSLPFDVSWEPDLWGSIRRGITVRPPPPRLASAIWKTPSCFTRRS